MFSLFSRTKVCSRCQREKTLKEFPKWSKSPDGRNHWCLQCHREYKRAHKAHLVTLDFAKCSPLLIEIEHRAIRESRSPQDVILGMISTQVGGGEG